MDCLQVWEHLQQFFSWAYPATLDLLKALAAPIVAYAALKVSRQQVRINETKLRLDLYDRRIDVYGAVKGLFEAFGEKGTIHQEDLAKYREGVVEADFLFGEDVTRYIAALDEGARRLIIETYKYEHRRQAEAHTDEHPYAKVDALHDWLLEQRQVAKDVFKRTLALEPK